MGTPNASTPKPQLNLQSNHPRTDEGRKMREAFTNVRMVCHACRREWLLPVGLLFDADCCSECGRKGVQS